MKKRLFAIKPVELLREEMESGTERLRRVLGPISLTSLGVGSIIGTGIFVMTGFAVREYAGPSLVVSLVVAGLGCAFAALCYAEFASLVPVAGSTYTYAYATVGEIFAWIIGWDLVLEYAMAGSVVAHGWSHYFTELLKLFDVHFPMWLAFDPFSDDGLKHGAILDLPAGFIILAITVLLVLGIRESAGFNAIMVVLKVGVLVFVIALGAVHVNTENWRPFMPGGFTGMMSGAAFMFFAYIGFDSVSTHAEEAIRPERDVPIGILGSLGVCTILYIGVTLVLTGMVPAPEIDIHAPLAVAFSRYGLGLAATLVSIGALAGTTSVILVTLLSQARIFLAIARDGLLPKGFFGAVHPRFHTPYKSTMLTGVVTAVVAALTPIGTLAELVNIGTLLAFVMVCTAVWALRRTRPELRRPFRCPLVPVIPILGILFNLALMVSLEWVNWIRLLVWLAIGMAIYVGYGIHRSRLAGMSPAQIAARAGQIRSQGPPGAPPGEGS